MSNYIVEELVNKNQFTEGSAPILVGVQQNDGAGYINKKEDGLFLNKLFKFYNGRVLSDGTLAFIDSAIGIATSQIVTGVYTIDIPFGSIETVQVTLETIGAKAAYEIIGQQITVTIVDQAGGNINSAFSLTIRCI